MKKLMVAMGVMALLLCGTALVSYGQGPGSHRGFGGPGFGLALHELNLTDAQKAQVKQIMEANKVTMKPLMVQMEQNRLAMLNAAANGAYDAGKVQALAGQRAQLEATMIMNREAIQHQIYTQVLTPEQQAKAEQLRSEQAAHITQHLQNMANGTDTAAPPAN